MNDIHLVRKSLHFGVLLLCLQIRIIRGERRSTPHPVRSEWRYIDNWDKYKLPKPVHERDLTAILAKVAGYKNLKYCPFENPKDCLRLSMDEAIKKIVEVNVKYSQNFYTLKPVHAGKDDFSKSQRARPFVDSPLFGSRNALYMTKKRRG